MYEFLDRIKIIKGDIVQQADVDAIVCGLYPDMALEGSLNQTVMAAAGTRLDEFILENIYKPRTSDAFAVPGFGLSVRHVLFMVKPRWRDGFFEEDRYLLRAYRSVMEMAHNMNLRRIAFPALGAGTKQFPVRRVARLALQGITERQLGDIEEVRIVCKTDETYAAFRDQLEKIKGEQGTRL